MKLESGGFQSIGWQSGVEWVSWGIFQSLHNTFLWKCITVRSKEIFEDIKKGLLMLNMLERVTKQISKEFGLQQSTVRWIVYKWLKVRIVFPLSRSGQPTKITQCKLKTQRQEKRHSAIH